MKKQQIRRQLIQTVKEQQLFRADEHVVVALSGGFDSLHLAQWLTEGHLPQALQPVVSVVYINHQLRDDAAVEEAFVADWLQQHRTQFKQVAMLKMDWSAQPEHGVEEQARQQRYVLLKQQALQWGTSIIVTAHHQDDQAETILFKLARGSQLQQLGGMAARQVMPDFEIRRPFLTLKKTELPLLVDIPIENYIVDSTNQDTNYARNLIRQTIMPAIGQLNQNFAENMVRSAQQLTALEALAKPEILAAVLRIQAGTYDFMQADQTQTSLVLQAWLQQQGCYQVKHRQLTQIWQLMRNQSINRGMVQLAKPWVVYRQGQKLILKQDSGKN